MTVLLILASVFWGLFFLYPWIDLAMGNHGWLEIRIRDWFFKFAEENEMCSLFAPIDIEAMMKELRR